MMADYMAALVEARERGVTRMIGASNFPIAWLERATAIVGTGQIVNNQVELHPYLQNRKLRDFCDRNRISVTAYMPLGKGKVLSDAVIGDIAARHEMTPAIVTLAWLQQLGIIVIPASANRRHTEANLRAGDPQLSGPEMAAMGALDRGERMIDPPKAPAWD